MSTRVLGYVIAQNEWPMLGLSISHALHMGVDHVIAVNHCSTDETAEGLQRLENAWPGRLSVVSTDVPGFPQAIISKVVLKALAKNGYDWVYAFDADEFLLTEHNEPLPSLLANIHANTQTIRYELDQFVAPYDMDDLVAEQFSRFTHRALGCDQTRQNGASLADDLVAGHINYFDIPFPSKVIVRRQYAHQLLTGAHGLEPDATVGKKVTEQIFTKNRMRVGHLPLTSKRRIKQKALHGQVLIEAGFPRGHGWQNQALHLIDQAGGLETYWTNHSIPIVNGANNPFCDTDTASSSLPPMVEDMALIHPLQRAIDTLKRPEQHFASDGQNSNAQKPEIDLASIITVVNDQHNRTQNLEMLLSERDKKLNELLDSLTVANESIRSAELKLYERGMDITTLKTDKTQLQDQVDALMHSSSWKLTAPLRRFAMILRRRPR
jgi:hypothetical protein